MIIILIMPYVYIKDKTTLTMEIEDGPINMKKLCSQIAGRLVQDYITKNNLNANEFYKTYFDFIVEHTWFLISGKHISSKTTEVWSSDDLKDKTIYVNYR